LFSCAYLLFRSLPSLGLVKTENIDEAVIWWSLMARDAMPSVDVQSA
jgi:hypothetical protein